MCIRDSPATTTVAADSTDFSLVRDAVTLRGWKLNPGNNDALIYFGGNAERLESCLLYTSRCV